MLQNSDNPTPFGCNKTHRSIQVKMSKPLVSLLHHELPKKNIPYTGSQETIRSKHPHQQDEIYQPTRSCRARGLADSISPKRHDFVHRSEKMTRILSVKWGERILSRNFNHHLQLLKEMNWCFLSSYWRMQKKIVPSIPPNSKNPSLISGQSALSQIFISLICSSPQHESKCLPWRSRQEAPIQRHDW